MRETDPGPTLKIHQGNADQAVIRAKTRTNGVESNRPITGASLWFTVRTDENQPDPEFQRKNTAAGGDATQIEDTDLANGQFTVKFERTNTLNLAAGEYFYDIHMVITGDDDETLCTGTFIVLKAWTLNDK